MANTSVRVMLLGIGLLLFGLAFPTTFLPLIVVWSQAATHLSRAAFYLLDSIFPLAGLIVLLIGFFIGQRRTS